MTSQPLAGAGLALVHAPFARGRAAVVAAAAELSEHRTRIDHRVGAVVGSGWRGGAADAFDEAWAQWRAGADDVRDGLEAMAELLAAARHHVTCADESSGAQLEGLAARLVERLGR